MGRSLNKRILVRSFFSLRYNDGFLFKMESINFLFKKRRGSNSFLDNSLSEGYLLKWLGGKRYSLWNRMVNGWKIVWS